MCFPKINNFITIIFLSVYLTITASYSHAAENCDKNCLFQRMQTGIQQSAQYYNIPESLLWIIAKVESNYNFYAINKNKNGTYDYGVFQINSSNLKKLQYPVSFAYDPYTASFIAAYILKKCIVEKGYNWSAIDCYNKGKNNARENSKYVWNFYKTWLKMVSNQ